jgi:FkbM family methyltransferase
MQYYAQAQEDRIMIEKYLRDMPLERRVYFECGALDGLLYSNTRTLEESLNWTGILVEANPVSFAQLKKNRSGNKLFNSLLSDQAEPVEFSYYANVNLAAVSGVTETFPDKLREAFYDAPKGDWMQKQRKNLQKVIIQPRRLSDVIIESGFSSIGFASLDVEGHEMQILSSYDWSFPTEYFLVEDNNGSEIRMLFEDNGYRFLGDVAHNLLFHRAID